MQPMQLCICWSKLFEKTSENSLRGKKHICNECDYASINGGNLKKHMKYHSGIKAHKCNQCAYASVQAADLNIHLKAHSGEKSHKCNKCDFASSYAGNLRRHMKIHPNKWLVLSKTQLLSPPGYLGARLVWDIHQPKSPPPLLFCLSVWNCLKLN